MKTTGEASPNTRYKTKNLNALQSSSELDMVKALEGFLIATAVSPTHTPHTDNTHITHITHTRTDANIWSTSVNAAKSF